MNVRKHFVCVSLLFCSTAIFSMEVIEHNQKVAKSLRQTLQEKQNKLNKLRQNFFKMRDAYHDAKYSSPFQAGEEDFSLADKLNDAKWAKEDYLAQRQNYRAEKNEIEFEMESIRRQIERFQKNQEQPKPGNKPKTKKKKLGFLSFSTGDLQTALLKLSLAQSRSSENLTKPLLQKGSKK